MTPQICLVCLLCDYITLLGSEQLTGTSLVDVFTLLTFHLTPNQAPRTHPLTVPNLGRGHRFFCLAICLLIASSTGWEACRLPGVQRKEFSLACLTTFLQVGFQLIFWLPCCTVLTEWISLFLHMGLSSLSRQAGNERLGHSIQLRFLKQLASHSLWIAWNYTRNSNCHKFVMLKPRDYRYTFSSLCSMRRLCLEANYYQI